VLATSGEIVDEKTPVPVPFEVEFTEGRVGFDAVPQTTPRAETDDPPSAVTFPPPLTVFVKIEEIAVVDTVGKDRVVTVPLTTKSLPAAEPAPVVKTPEKKNQPKTEQPVQKAVVVAEKPKEESPKPAQKVAEKSSQPKVETKVETN
jgi:hypothetical protein